MRDNRVCFSRIIPIFFSSFLPWKHHIQDSFSPAQAWLLPVVQTGLDLWLPHLCQLVNGSDGMSLG